MHLNIIYPIEIVLFTDVDDIKTCLNEQPVEEPSVLNNIVIISNVLTTEWVFLTRFSWFIRLEIDIIYRNASSNDQMKYSSKDPLDTTLTNEIDYEHLKKGTINSIEFVFWNYSKF